MIRWLVFAKNGNHTNPTSEKCLKDSGEALFGLLTLSLSRLDAAVSAIFYAHLFLIIKNIPFTKNGI
jgi:hypothetical protein